MLTEALMKGCADCEIELDRQESSSFVRPAETTTNIPKKSEVRLDKKLDLAMKEMMKVLNKKAEDSQTGMTTFFVSLIIAPHHCTSRHFNDF